MNLVNRDDVAAIEPFGLLLLLIPLTVGAGLVQAVFGIENIWLAGAIFVVLFLAARSLWRAILEKLDA